MNALIRTTGTRAACAAILLLGTGGAAMAADIEREGPRLRVMGILDGSGLAAFTGQLASGQIRTVVFEDSRGGTAEVAEHYARAIREADVNTEVRGQCNAACAYAFLAGKEHRFGRGSQVNSLLIPLGTRPDTGDLAQLSARSGAHGAAPGGGQASVTGGGQGTVQSPLRPTSSVEVSAETPATTHEPAPAVAGETWRAGQGVLFTSTPTLFGRVYNSYYCDGTQGRDLSKCEPLSDADPYRLGVLTAQ